MPHEHELEYYAQLQGIHLEKKGYVDWFFIIIKKQN